MELPLYQVDAFTDRLFAGNPAAVCPLPRWLKDETMQSIAAENNLAETAFFLAEGEGFRLRWFTPTVEIDLCGHATLASAFVISSFLEPTRRQMHFETRSGRLTVTREGDSYLLDFPVWGLKPARNPAVGKAMGRDPSELFASIPYLAVYDSAAEVAALDPDLKAVAALDLDGVLATAPGRERDRLCRPLFRAGRRHSRGSRHRLGAMRAHALLGGAAEAPAPGRPPDLQARRRFPLRARGRSRAYRRPGGLLSQGEHCCRRLSSAAPPIDGESISCSAPGRCCRF